MLKNKILAVTIGLLLATTTANTQTLRSDTGPAERPPASFKGKQYVDSKGCVYIRAGSGARVTWVPRVNRSKKVFCSSRNKSSLSATQLSTISGKPATRVKAPVVKAKPAPKPVAVATAPAVQPKKTTTFNNPVFVAKPTQKVVKPVKTVRQAPLIITPQAIVPPKAVAQRPVQQQFNKPRKVTSNTATGRYAVRRGPQAVHPADVIGLVSREGGGDARVVATPTPQLKSVRGTSASQRRGYRNLAIRNGPQAIHPADTIRAANAGAVYQQSASSGKASTPFKNGKDSLHNITVYKSTIGFDVTPRGDAQMEKIWTNTVPRRLITKVRARETLVPATTAQQQDIFRVSSKNAKKAPKAAKLKARYVQLGTFGDMANANKTITFFQKRGQKVSARAIKRSGKNYRVIFLGPFKSNSQATNALASARSAGFGNAFYVR